MDKLRDLSEACDSPLDIIVQNEKYLLEANVTSGKMAGRYLTLSAHDVFLPVVFPTAQKVTGG